MLHLCTGLRPVPGSRYSKPCPRQVRSALGRCERCRPAAPRAAAAPEDRARWNRVHRETLARRTASAGVLGGA